jgi:hypothetical protein
MFQCVASEGFFFLTVLTHVQVTHMCINVNNTQKLFLFSRNLKV